MFNLFDALELTSGLVEHGARDGTSGGGGLL
jgi:hypothetical protein